MTDSFEWKVPSYYADPAFNLSVYKAAPDMYEALKEIQELMGTPIETYEEFQKIAPPIFNKGKQALAKAEGGE